MEQHYTENGLRSGPNRNNSFQSLDLFSALRRVLIRAPNGTRYQDCLRQIPAYQLPSDGDSWVQAAAVLKVHVVVVLPFRFGSVEFPRSATTAWPAAVLTLHARRATWRHIDRNSISCV